MVDPRDVPNFIKLFNFVGANKRTKSLDQFREEALAKAKELGMQSSEADIWQQLVKKFEPRQQAAPASSAPTRPRAPREQKSKWSGEVTNLATAPFRFAAVEPKVARLDPGAQISHADPTGADLSCVLDVDWALETPLLIGENDAADVSQPFKLGDTYAIPGATLRGAIRSTLEVLAHGRLFQVNRHHRYALRDFEHPSYSTFIKKSLEDGGLGAGWLSKCPETGAAQITPVDWQYALISDMIESTDKRDIVDWIKKKRVAKYATFGLSMTQDALEQQSSKFRKSSRPDDKGRLVCSPDPSGEVGCYVMSGPVPMKRDEVEVKKRFEYVFFDTGKSAVTLEDSCWQSFQQRHSKPSKNALKPDGAWVDFAEVFERGSKVPVFFVGSLEENATDPSFSFGLTRLYRIPHDYTVGEILTRSGKQHLPAEERRIDRETTYTLRPDFVEHLFGYVYEPDELEFGHEDGIRQSKKTGQYTQPGSVSRKGRVAFGFATASRQDDFAPWPHSGPVETVMGAPKASYAPFYLRGSPKDYSSDKTETKLAGRKRYIARYQSGSFGPLETALKAQIGPKTGRDVRSRLRFIAPQSEQARMSGRIKGHHLTTAELGGLLWAIGFGGDADARHMIGRAKAFGAGQMRADTVTLHMRGTDGAPQESITWSPHKDGATPVKNYLDAFVCEVAKLTGKTPETWANSPSVKTLLDTARPQGWDRPRSKYLEFGTGAKDFNTLRKATGLGSESAKGLKPPTHLLE